MEERQQHVYEFGPFRLIPEESLLLRAGRPVALAPKNFEVLEALVRRSGSLVGKEELLKEVWPDSFVEEANLSRHVYALRRALGEDEEGRPYIETVPKRGYRFIAEVKELRDNGSELIVEGHTRTYINIEEETEVDTIAEPTVGQKALSPVGGAKGSSSRTLGRTVVVIALALVMGIAYVFLYPKGEQDRTMGAAGLKTIAVLPFKQMGAEVNDEYLGLGMADALITKLSNVRQFTVRPTSAVRKYAAAEQDPLTAGRELGVEAVLDGSVQRSGDRLRVTVQLLRVSDGAPLWAEKFDAKFKEGFAVHDSISAQAARALTVRLSEDDRRRLTKRETDVPEAYQAYLKGRYFWNKRSPEGLKKSVEYFNQAIEADPLYALAYAGLADSYVLYSDFHAVPPRDSFAKARAAAERALEIDRELAEAHTSLGYVNVSYDWDWAAAESNYQNALALNPNYATVLQWYAGYLLLMGRYEEAREHLARARELDPLSTIVQSMYAASFYYAREYDRAIEECRKALEMDQRSYWGRSYLWLSYERKGMHREAFEECFKIAELAGESPESLAALRARFELSGWKGYWEMVLARQNALAASRYVSPFARAMSALRGGDQAQTFDLLQKACDERIRYVPYIKIDPQFDPLRSDPRFRHLLGRVRLSP